MLIYNGIFCHLHLNPQNLYYHKCHTPPFSQLFIFSFFFQRLTNEPMQRAGGDRYHHGAGPEDPQRVRRPEETHGSINTPPQAASSRHRILRSLVLRQRGQEERLQGLAQVYQRDLQVWRADRHHGSLGSRKEHSHEYFSWLQVSELHIKYLGTRGNWRRVFIKLNCKRGRSSCVGN